MMQAGIFTGYFPYGLEETAQKIRGLGFNTVQLDMHFKDIDLSAGQITKDKAKRVREGNDVSIITFGALVERSNQAAKRLEQQGVSPTGDQHL